MTARAQTPNHRLAALMREAGVSNKGLAKRMADLGKRDSGEPVSPTHTNVDKWLSGATQRPQPRTCQVLVKALSQALSRRVTLDDVGYGEVAPEAADSTLEYPQTVGESITALTQLTRHELDPTNAAKLFVVPEAWASLLVKAMYGDDGDASTPPDPVDLSSDHVQQVHDATEMFSTFDHQYGGGQSKPLVAQYLQTAVLPLIPRVSPANPVGQQYFQAVASLTLRAGWTAYDIGEHARAQRYLYHAYRLARAAGDRAFSGHALACMSHQANFLGYYQDATHLARAAVHHGATGQATPTAMALFNAMEGRALASQGNEPEATSALMSAEGWLGKSQPADDPDWVWFFDAAELHAEFAHCFRDLGKADLAHSHASAAISESKDVFVRSLSFCRSVLATSHLLANELDQALEVATGVVDTAAHLNSYRVVSYLNAFRQRLATEFDSPRIQAFDDYFRDKLQSESSPLSGRLVIP